MKNSWYVVCPMHDVILRVDEWPFLVGREVGEVGNCLKMSEPFISRQQFVLEMRAGRLWYVNKSSTHPAFIDGGYPMALELSPDALHIVKLGHVVIGLGTDADLVYQVALEQSPPLFKVILNGNEVGPLLAEHLRAACKRGVFAENTVVYYLRDPKPRYKLGELLSRLDQGLKPIPFEVLPSSHWKQQPAAEAPVAEPEPTLGSDTAN